MNSTTKSKKRSHWFLKTLLATLTSGLLAATLLLIYLWIITPSYPTFEAYKQAHQPSDIQVLDRHNQPLHRLRVNFQVRQGEWIALDNMSPALIKALLITEDKRFYEHSGVDFKAVLAAVWNKVSNTNPRGASTLTMQFVGLLDERIAPSGRRTLWQKMQQAVAAIVLEQEWTKEQILEAYLNTIPFRGEAVGISAATEGLLSKHPNGMSEKEAAMMVALIRSPNASEQKVTDRACVILEQMQAMNADDECKSLGYLTHVYFSKPRPSPSQGIAPHLTMQMLKAAAAQRQKPLSTIHTTVDAQLQQKTLESLRHHLTENSHRNIEDGAVIVLDNQTGEILAWVGSSGADLSQADQVDAVTAMRQPGSTLKPFLYAQAIEEKRLTAASLLNDSPLNLNVGGALYVPQNYDRQYKGWVSVRTALASSLNIPAVRTIVMLEADSFAKTLTDLGLPLTQSGDYYGYSLALGSAEVSLLTLTNAYRVLANGGQVSGVRWQSDSANTPSAIPAYALTLEPHRSHISPQTAWIIGSILSDRMARVTTFGLDNELNTRYWSAVKTGTSKDMRDNWAIGYSGRYTIGVWVGNASGAAMWGVSGTSGATPVWVDVMNYLYERDLQSGKASYWIAPQIPDGIVTQSIHYLPPVEPPRQEWFLKGSEQETFMIVTEDRSADTSDAARILEPVNGIIIALDPDIPPENQRIRLISNHQNVHWRLNDSHIIGTGAQVDWLPLPGRHTLILSDQEGKTLDQIRIEVRGASLSRATMGNLP
ncbi:MAG: penicillin-binding protein 1C [Saezia sp.]